MTILEAITEIYKMYEKSSEAVDPTSEDFIVRLSYANAAIDKWENEEGMDWKELYATISDTLDANGQFSNTVTLANFKRPAHYLVIGTTNYGYVRPERWEVESQGSRKVYTVTGSKGTHTIKVNPNPGAVAFTLGYRKTATKFSTGLEATQIEMSDPHFIVHDVLTLLYLDDRNNNQASYELQVAQAKMDAMKRVNETAPFYQPSQIDDDSFKGFGI